MTAEWTIERTPADTEACIGTALEAALLVMRNGGSTAAAERSVSSILRAARVEGVSPVWRLDFIAAAHGGAIFVRSVGPVGVNLARVAAITELSARAAEGAVTLDAIDAELARIEQLPSPYHAWVKVLFAAATAACFSQLPGGDWGSFGIAFVAAGTGQVVRTAPQASKLANAPVTLICGVLSALIACAALRFGLSAVEPATLIASVIYLVPGLPLINGFIDVVTRHLLVGLERIMNAAYLFLLLAIAMAFAHAVFL